MPHFSSDRRGTVLPSSVVKISVQVLNLESSSQSTHSQPSQCCVARNIATYRSDFFQNVEYDGSNCCVECANINHTISLNNIT